MATKNELLNWTNALLCLNCHRLEQFANAALYCQLLDAHYPGVISIFKVDFTAIQEHTSLRNWKTFQAGLKAARLHVWELDITKLSKGALRENLELLRWLHKQLADLEVIPGYEPSTRRAASAKGNPLQIPVPSACTPRSSLNLSRTFSSPLSSPSVGKPYREVSSRWRENLAPPCLSPSSSFRRSTSFRPAPAMPTLLSSPSMKDRQADDIDAFDASGPSSRDSMEASIMSGEQQTPQRGIASSRTPSATEPKRAQSMPTSILTPQPPKSSLDSATAAHRVRKLQLRRPDPVIALPAAPLSDHVHVRCGNVSGGSTCSTESQQDSELISLTSTSQRSSVTASTCTIETQTDADLLSPYQLSRLPSIPSQSVLTEYNVLNRDADQPGAQHAAPRQDCSAGEGTTEKLLSGFESGDMGSCIATQTSHVDSREAGQQQLDAEPEFNVNTAEQQQNTLKDIASGQIGNTVYNNNNNNNNNNSNGGVNVPLQEALRTSSASTVESEHDALHYLMAELMTDLTDNAAQGNAAHGTQHAPTHAFVTVDDGSKQHDAAVVVDDNQMSDSELSSVYEVYHQPVGSLSASRTFGACTYDPLCSDAEDNNSVTNNNKSRFAPFTSYEDEVMHANPLYISPRQDRHGSPAPVTGTNTSPDVCRTLFDAQPVYSIDSHVVHATGAQQHTACDGEGMQRDAHTQPGGRAPEYVGPSPTEGSPMPFNISSTSLYSPQRNVHFNNSDSLTQPGSSYAGSALVTGGVNNAQAPTSASHTVPMSVHVRSHRIDDLFDDSAAQQAPPAEPALTYPQVDSSSLASSKATSSVNNSTTSVSDRLAEHLRQRKAALQAQPPVSSVAAKLQANLRAAAATTTSNEHESNKSTGDNDTCTLQQQRKRVHNRSPRTPSRESPRRLASISEAELAVQCVSPTSSDISVIMSALSIGQSALMPRLHSFALPLDESDMSDMEADRSDSHALDRLISKPVRTRNTVMVSQQQPPANKALMQAMFSDSESMCDDEHVQFMPASVLDPETRQYASAAASNDSNPANNVMHPPSRRLTTSFELPATDLIISQPSSPSEASPPPQQPRRTSTSASTFGNFAALIEPTSFSLYEAPSVASETRELVVATPGTEPETPPELANDRAPRTHSFDIHRTHADESTSAPSSSWKRASLKVTSSLLVIVPAATKYKTLFSTLRTVVQTVRAIKPSIDKDT